MSADQYAENAHCSDLIARLEKATDYRVEMRGDVFDLVHLSGAYIGGRYIKLREIVRGNIPVAELRALQAKEGEHG